MRRETASVHLDLWRGIDDAVWREALRGVRPAEGQPAAPPRAAGRRVEARGPAVVVVKVPEPA